MHSRLARHSVWMVIVAGTLAACGGDGGGTGTTAASTTTTSMATSSTTSATTTLAPAPTEPATSAPAPTDTIAPETTPPSAAPTEPPTTPAPTLPPAAPPPPADQIKKLNLALEPFADVSLPTALTSRPGDTALYLTAQDGKVWRVGAAAGEPTVVLDLTAEVSPYVNGSERGMLGIAFDPIDGRMFVYFTDADIDSHVVSFALDAAGIADPASRRDVMFEEQPGLGHKGGGMAFDAAGNLYIAFGDGGASSGRDAQDYGNVLGGVARIVPKRDGNSGYDVPPDNPYVGQEGKRPEIWAKGLRNPWGFSMDQATGDIWIGDVGNHIMEEIDRIPAGHGGVNFGWPYLEGTEHKNRGAPADVVPPVYAYLHDEFGPAVIGGRVYRGSAIPELVGAYVFADMSGPMLAIGAGDEAVRLDVNGSGVVTGFGTDAQGEIYVLSLGNGIERLVAA